MDDVPNRADQAAQQKRVSADSVLRGSTGPGRLPGCEGAAPAERRGGRILAPAAALARAVGRARPGAPAHSAASRARDPSLT